ncbi:MAG: FHA domain-containing protein [Pirellulaceae bacterium]|nr:FHA domain-containing protein [Pirellulaceae bacterium]
MYGELTPQGGGDPIPLLKETLLIGRRESCDIVLRFGNVSGQHCQLSLENGYWFVQDMNSQNGVKVNGVKVVRKRLDPGALLSVARHKYTIHYSPKDLGATGPPPSDEEDISSVLGKSLLEKAGLQRRPEASTRRYDPTKDAPGQIRRGQHDD